MDPITKSQTDDENWDGMTAEIANSGESLDSLMDFGKSPVLGKEENGAAPVEGVPSSSAEPVVPDAVPEVGDGVVADTPQVEAPLGSEGHPEAVDLVVGKEKPKTPARKRRQVMPVPKQVSDEGGNSSDKKVFFLLPMTTFFLFQCIVMGKGQKCSVVLRSLVEEYVKRNASVLDEVASRISGNG